MNKGDLPIGIDTHTTTIRDQWRNRWAGKLANAALAIATPEYRKFIAGAILYGMNAAARDMADGDEPPAMWFERDAS